MVVCVIAFWIQDPDWYVDWLGGVAAMAGLLIASFAVWGVRDVFRNQVSNSVIKAGSHEVSASDFKLIFDRVAFAPVNEALAQRAAG